MKLGLFFTRNTSLKTWVESGLLEREKLIYERHLIDSNACEIYWFTYGSEDKEIAEKLKRDGALNSNITVVSMPKVFEGKIGSWLYSIILPFLHYNILRDLNIFKSNQMDGAWSALISSLIFKGKFYLRTGYTLSVFTKKQKRKKVFILFHQFIEKVCYMFADISSVSSKLDRQYVCSKYKPISDVNVLYNYVDTENFRNYEKERKDEFVFIGRFNDQKNIYNTIEAVILNNMKISLYGAGELKDEISKKYENNRNVKFYGKVPNDEIPSILNLYKYYILASHYEGMPKTLIEAVACGNICIGTNVEGINEVLNEEIGYLAPNTSVECISQTVAKAIANQEGNIYQKIANYGEEKFSISSIVLKDFEIMNKVLS